MLDYLKMASFSLVFIYWPLLLATFAVVIVVQSKTIRWLGATTEEVVDYMGYEAVGHDVDSFGYSVRVTRMINPLANPKNVNRSILFLHGLAQDSVIDYLSFAQWARPSVPEPHSYVPKPIDMTKVDPNVTTTTTKRPRRRRPGKRELRRLCLPCMFSDHNYDVWMMDERGSNKYSLQVNVPKLKNFHTYWNYTVDDSVIDLTRVIDYVLRTTERERLNFVGVSKGTILALAALSDHRYLEEKLQSVTLITPIFYGIGVRGLMKILASIPSFITDFNRPIFTYSQTMLLNSIMSTLCTLPILRQFCVLVANAIGGPDPNRENIITDVALTHIVEPQSLKSIAHLGQALAAKTKTSKFDYGPQRNLKMYGLPEPPEYNLSNIKFDKIILVRSEVNDYLSVKEGHTRIINTLGAPIFRDLVTPDSYNHFGALINMNAYDEVYVPILNAVNESYLPSSGTNSSTTNTTTVENPGDQAPKMRTSIDAATANDDTDNTDSDTEDDNGANVK